MQLVLDSKGLKLSVRNQCFFITNAAESRLISPVRVSSILISAGVLITASAILLAVKNNLPVIIEEPRSGTFASVRSAGYNNLARFRRWQLQFSHSEKSIEWISNLLLQKFDQQLNNARVWQKNMKLQEPVFNELVLRIEQRIAALKITWRMPALLTKEEILNAEAIIAGYYWKAVGLAVPAFYKLEGRHHRPAKDMFNAALNYWYGMLYHQVESAIHSAGLDVGCSLLHAEDYHTPALCYDLIEPFRPQADAALVALCQDQILQNQHFETKETGMWLSKKGKQIIIPAFHVWLHEKILFNNHTTLRKNHVLQLPFSLLKYIRSQYETV